MMLWLAGFGTETVMSELGAERGTCGTGIEIVLVSGLIRTGTFPPLPGVEFGTGTEIEISSHAGPVASSGTGMDGLAPETDCCAVLAPEEVELSSEMWNCGTGRSTSTHSVSSLSFLTLPASDKLMTPVHAEYKLS